jgi:hypothetical protein
VATRGSSNVAEYAVDKEYERGQKRFYKRLAEQMLSGVLTRRGLLSPITGANGPHFQRGRNNGTGTAMMFSTDNCGCLEGFNWALWEDFEERGWRGANGDSRARGWTMER